MTAFFTLLPVRARGAFTLIEVLIVTAILGILASITVPNYRTKIGESREQGFIQQLRTNANAVQIHYARRSHFPDEAAAGVVPTTLTPYLQAGAWDSPTPIGGRWRHVRSLPGISSAIGVDFGTAAGPVDMLAGIDARFDDGDLATGRFQQFTPSTFYLILEF